MSPNPDQLQFITTGPTRRNPAFMIVRPKSPPRRRKADDRDRTQRRVYRGPAFLTEKKEEIKPEPPSPEEQAPVLNSAQPR